MATDIDRGQQAAAEDARRREDQRGYGPDYRQDDDRGYSLDYGRNLAGDDYGTGAAEPYEESNLEGYGGIPADRTEGRAGRPGGRGAWSQARERREWSDAGSWSRPGPMTGRGPRNYRRTDDRIMEDVCERLTEHGGIDAGDVEVKVSGGEVVLLGTVRERREKWLAEDLAEDVSGVREVRNEIHVRDHYVTG